MFKKILIANRGEIACRVIKTARRMGIATVAVFSEIDRRAPHVALADEAVCVGPPPAAESYLDIQRIVVACRETGADAVHPGYGFLSERAAFARALAAAGVVFIGPNADAIDAMGDKIAAKRLAREAGVSTVPGHLGAIVDADEARRVADGIGYPVMIKASAGGGGKGMRVAATRDDVAEGFTRARSEALASFGDDRVFIERFIADPRHIEIQVIGDKHGTIVHLLERECSIQRRNQKVVEEAPSPLLDEAMRAAMGAEAIALARAVGYDSAGTVEFVVAQDKSFYFLEMNTRLQVEHPVTEAITGVDIVEAMIRVAAGEPLGLTQDRIQCDGWAIETRIYAEDPARGFLPSTGRIKTYRPPTRAARADASVRVDAGVVEGGTITAHYDPMIAKLITHAPTREAAIGAQIDALDGFVIEGIQHNLSFLSALMRRPRWREGRLSTRFIADEFGEGYAPPQPDGMVARVFVAAALARDAALFDRRLNLPGRLRPERPDDYGRDWSVWLGSTRQDVGVVREGARFAVTFIDGNIITFESDWSPAQKVWHGRVAGCDVVVAARPASNGVWLSHAGFVVLARVLTPRQADLARIMPLQQGAETGRVLLCPMPGLVKAIAVTVGQDVRSGDPLCLLEAMKMETMLKAEHDGTVATIEVCEGDHVAVDAVLMTFA